MRIPTDLVRIGHVILFERTGDNEKHVRKGFLESGTPFHFFILHRPNIMELEGREVAKWFPLPAEKNK